MCRSLSLFLVSPMLNGSSSWTSACPLCSQIFLHGRGSKQVLLNRLRCLEVASLVLAGIS